MDDLPNGIDGVNRLRPRCRPRISFSAPAGNDPCPCGSVEECQKVPRGDSQVSVAARRGHLKRRSSKKPWRGGFSRRRSGPQLGVRSIPSQPTSRDNPPRVAQCGDDETPEVSTIASWMPVGRPGGRAGAMLVDCVGSDRWPQQQAARAGSRTARAQLGRV